jgi:riboflavin synthase
LDIRPGLHTLGIAMPEDLRRGLIPGASVSVDGVCLTVVSIEDSTVIFQAMDETLQRTTLGQRRKGELVNVERSAVFGEEIGGHPLSGHVDGRAKIVAIESPKNNCVITFAFDRRYKDYLFEKGFIAVDGASLTISRLDRDAGTFSVYLIPETLKRTTLGTKQIGDEVNIEIDRMTQAIVETVRNVLKDRMDAASTPAQAVS